METPAINNGPLFKRIALVMASVRGMAKDGHNTQSNFSYISSDGALDRIGKAMAENGLVIIPMLIDYDSVDESPKGTSIRTRTRARFQMHICDSDGNSFMTTWAGEGTDYGNPDRALNKAMTNATKYFLLKLFVVGAGDGDPDDDGEAATTGKPATKTVQQQATKPQPQTQRPASAQPQAAAPDDNPFDDKKAHPPAQSGGKPHVSQVRLNRLHAVGTQAYGAEWNEKRKQLVQMVSKGSVTSSKDLTPREAEDLISGIEKKLMETPAAVKSDGAQVKA